uniref:Transport and golgi organization 6 homolog n=1 Tax=Junco hyemalis TaxID=40217 RepID=A0A8C5IVT8_JUNHY
MSCQLPAKQHMGGSLAAKRRQAVPSEGLLTLVSLSLQILDLLHVQDKVAARQFQRVATSTVLSMAREQPQLAERLLLQPLLAPLRRCSEATGTSLGWGSLWFCSSLVFVFVVGNDSSSLLLGSLQPVLGVVFSLYSFASLCALPLLEFHLAGKEGFQGKAAWDFTVPCRLGARGSGGVCAGGTVTCSSDEDEALYQKISLEQCHVESLVELVSHCQKSGLAGDFFIHCLKELTQVAAEDEEAPNPAVEPGGSLLELEQHQARQGRKLLVLQLVAALCQGVSDTVFTDIEQVGGPAGRAPSPPAHRDSSSTGQSRGRDPGASAAPRAPSPAPGGLQELLESACDPQPPARAAALRHLASLVTQRDPEAARLQEKLLQVFLENVQHEDAFVYLSAIQGDETPWLWHRGCSVPARHRWIPAVDVMPVSHTLLFWEGASSANSPGCHCRDLIRFLWLCLIFIQTLVQHPCAPGPGEAAGSLHPTGHGVPSSFLGHCQHGSGCSMASPASLSPW